MYGEGNTVNVMEASEGIMEASEGNRIEEKEGASESDSWELVTKEDASDVTMERLYCTPWGRTSEDTERRLAQMGGEVEKKVDYRDLDYDTDDLLLYRRGTWLRKRAEQGVWQIRHCSYLEYNIGAY